MTDRAKLWGCRFFRWPWKMAMDVSEYYSLPHWWLSRSSRL